MPTENYFPPIGLNESTFTRDEAERLLKFRSFQQQTEIIVAASDTPGTLAYMAKYKCDGTDDHVQIDEALQEARDNGGGVVRLLSGTYYFGSNANPGVFPAEPLINVNGYNSVELRGSGQDATLIKPQNRDTSDTTLDMCWFGTPSGGTGVNAFVIADITFDGLVPIYNGKHVDRPIFMVNTSNEDCQYLNLTFKDFDSSGGGPNIIDALGANHRISGCTFENLPASACTIGAGGWIFQCAFRDVGSIEAEEAVSLSGEGASIMQCTLTGTGGVDAQAVGTMVIGNRFDYDPTHPANYGWAVQAFSGQGSIIMGNSITGNWHSIYCASGSDYLIANNVISSTYGPGIHIGSGVTDVVITGNRIDNTGGNGIIVEDLTSGISITDNNIELATVHGINIGGSDYSQVNNNRIGNSGRSGIYLTGACDSMQVNDNYLFNNSQDAAGTYDAIFVDNSTNMNHNSIQGNVIRGSVQHRYGIYLAGANVNNTLVANNDLAFAGATGAFFDGGTGTDILGGNRT